MAESRKRFRFPNWNAHSVFNKRQEIEAMLSLHDLDMLCVTETWLTPDYVFEFFGYLTFRCDRRLGRGDGALILIRSDLAVTGMDLPIPYGDAFEAVGITVRSLLGVLAIVCAYMPPNADVDLLAWRSLLACVPNGAAILFCGDLNAHSGYWGSPCTLITLRTLTSRISVLAATSSHGIFSLDSSWVMTPDLSTGVSFQASPLLWRPAARTTPPPCAVRERFSRSGGTPNVTRLLLGGGRPSRITCVTRIDWGWLLFAVWIRK